MYQSISEFVQDYTAESDRTLKLLNALTDASLDQAITDDHRTLGRIAWHLAITAPEMLSHAGLHLKSVDPEAPVPMSAAKIAASYKAVVHELLQMIQAQWTDESLDVVSDFYGEQWSRKAALEAYIRHEIHHRGQMTVLMRQADLKIPGIYGPALEEWAAMGMPIPQI